MAVLEQERLCTGTCGEDHQQQSDKQEWRTRPSEGVLPAKVLRAHEKKVLCPVPADRESKSFSQASAATVNWCCGETGLIGSRESDENAGERESKNGVTLRGSSGSRITTVRIGRE